MWHHWTEKHTGYLMVGKSEEHRTLGRNVCVDGIALKTNLQKTGKV
jgi:hypothetical protein